MKRCLAALLALCALLSLCACGAAAPETDGGTFSLDILDTGKSDCIIVCMDGVTVVNDAADEDDFDSICAALERRGVERIDYLVLSLTTRITSAPRRRSCARTRWGRSSARTTKRIPCISRCSSAPRKSGIRRSSA